MSEYIPPDESVRKHGYRPNTDQLMLELHRLLTIFLSSKAIADLRASDEKNYGPLDNPQEVEEDEVTRLLLAIAVSARVIDDREEKIFDFAALDCGVLAEHDGEKGLSLREACNKILHAQRIRFDLSETEAAQKYLNPIIYLYGHRNSGKEWKASLNVIDFVKELSWLRHF